VARFIGFEYVLAQALARRAQNVTGVFACVPGGAQLHSRANLDAIGGRIDDTTKAEDTVSTLLTQLRGRKVVFDGRAICWAEEPDTVDGLWKQRLRWFRGNLQIVGKYKHLWFRRTTPVGQWRFGISWFASMLQPLFMLLSTAALVVLYFTDYGLAGSMLRAFWITNALCWVVLGAFGLTVDRTMARECWFQCLTFTGVVSAVIILYALVPSPTLRALDGVPGVFGAHLSAPSLHWEVLFAGIWGSACMLFGFVTHWVESPRGPRRWLATVLLYLGGYGPLVCAVGLHAYIDHARGIDRRWEVTVKTGRSTGGRRDGTGGSPDGRALGPVATGAG